MDRHEPITVAEFEAHLAAAEEHLEAAGVASHRLRVTPEEKRSVERHLHSIASMLGLSVRWKVWDCPPRSEPSRRTPGSVYEGDA